MKVCGLKVFVCEGVWSESVCVQRCVLCEWSEVLCGWSEGVVCVCTSAVLCCTIVSMFVVFMTSSIGLTFPSCAGLLLSTQCDYLLLVAVTSTAARTTKLALHNRNTRLGCCTPGVLFAWFLRMVCLWYT